MSQRLFIKHLFSCVAPQFKHGAAFLTYRRNQISHCISYFCTNINNFNKAVVPQQPVDLLMQNLRSASDTTDILYNIQQHHAIMNNAHIMQALQTVFQLQKSQQSTMSNGELLHSDSFQLLCKILQNKVRYIELNDHLTALKVLSFIGVPTNSKVIQILLQLVTKQVNDLTLQQIVFLDFILKDFISCPLVDALKIALPIVFEAHFRLQRDGCDIKQLAEFFVFAIKRRLSEKCIDSFVGIINENKNELDIESSKIIVRTLCEAKRTETPYRILLHQCLDTIVDNIHRFTFHDLNNILSRLASNKRTSSHFYHEEFLNVCANYVIDRQCDSEQATWILRNCNKFRHMHKRLLDYICERIAENPSCFDKWATGMIVTFINGLSISDYRPDNFHIYENCIADNLLKFTNKLELPWLRICLDLCVLDCWSHELCNIVLGQDFLGHFLKRGNLEDSSELIQLYQALVTLCPSYQGNLPSPNLIEELVTKVQNIEDSKDRSPLLPALAHGLGGPSYVYSQVYTKLGHFIDHAVVMRKGGYSVSINNNMEDDAKNSIFVENITLPEDSQIILIIYITPKCYTINTERIEGHVRLNMNTLEAMGYSVVHVMQGVWENLLDNEKIPYLMQALQNKCQNQEDIAATRT
ncbi:FAST kinase domain-containing protein 2, mitochondrial-like [Lycorma delicatula]|uniref:FAST kinase domain-containing protein 2, mitochondrial-like n=1 Tax=Lycorma delicatula TaxID=130591 RepID=UPI003F518796